MFMAEMHLRHGFKYSACGPFTKNNMNDIEK